MLRSVFLQHCCSTLFIYMLKSVAFLQYVFKSGSKSELKKKDNCLCRFPCHNKILLLVFHFNGPLRCGFVWLPNVIDLRVLISL
jgi:hypothetical protein